MVLSPRIAFFSQNQLELMKTRVFELLEKRGVKMDHPQVLKLLDKAGAMVDVDSKIVRFPKKFLEEQISKTPKEFMLSAKDMKHQLEIPRKDGTFYTRTNTGAQSWIDLESAEYRPVTAADITTWARFADLLEHINFCAFPVPGDVPTWSTDVHALSIMLKNTGKHIWVQPYTQASVEYLINLFTEYGGQ